MKRPGKASLEKERRIAVAEIEALLNLQIDMLTGQVAELEKDREQLELFAQSSNEAIVVLDSAHKCININAQTTEMFGYTKEELEGRQGSHLLQSEYQGIAAAHALAHYRKPYEAVMQRKDGSTFYAMVQGREATYQGCHVYVMTCRDITNIKEMQEKLAKMARNDSLTGIYNRGYFMELSAREIARNRRYRHDLAMMMIDIDHFKKINDSMGHSGGDRALCHLVAVVRQSIRDTDVFGRIGGEEFAVMMIESSLKGAVAAAERIRSRLNTTTPFSGGLIPKMTVSIGVTEIDEEDSLDKALKKADTLLYQAKKSGRDRVMY